jgi:hypothetical protein
MELFATIIAYTTLTTTLMMRTVDKKRTAEVIGVTESIKNNNRICDDNRLKNVMELVIDHETQ